MKVTKNFSCYHIKFKVPISRSDWSAARADWKWCLTQRYLKGRFYLSKWKLFSYGTGKWFLMDFVWIGLKYHRCWGWLAVYVTVISYLSYWLMISIYISLMLFFTSMLVFFFLIYQFLRTFLVVFFLYKYSQLSTVANDKTFVRERERERKWREGRQKKGKNILITVK